MSDFVLPTGDGKRVLIVEQSEVLRLILRSLVGTWGPHCTCAERLVGACRTVVTEGPFDAVICNDNLPDGPADMFVEWLRTQNLHLPVLVMHDRRPAGAVPRGVRLLRKPVDPQEMKLALELALRVRLAEAGEKTASDAPTLVP